jgi:hypothetical protein
MNNTNYITSKIDQKSYCKSNGQFTRHLRQHNITYQGYYELYETGICMLCYCQKSLTFYQKSNSYANSCGDPICVGKTISATKQNWTTKQRELDSKHKKIAASNRTPAQIQAQKDKSSATARAKYGVDWVTQSDEYKAKSKATKLERYGNEHYAGWEASAHTNRNKTIVEQDAINDKRRATNLERFGVENVFMLPNNSSKTNKGNSSIKEYITPSGKVIGIRGYEHLVLDILFNDYNEDELYIHDDFAEYSIERFEYQAVDRKRLYYPDIYIPKENLIIEVKSEWWWNGKLDERYRNRLENNLRKRQSVIDKGYNFQLWLFSTKYTHRILHNDTDFQREHKKFKSIDC